MRLHQCLHRHHASYVYDVSALARQTAPQLQPNLASMPTIVEGVDFDTVAREWRCKWSADSDKASLAAAQEAINGVLTQVKVCARAARACESVRVQQAARVVCARSCCVWAHGCAAWPRAATGGQQEG